LVHTPEFQVEHGAEAELAVVAVVQSHLRRDGGALQCDLALRCRPSDRAEEAGAPARGEQLLGIGGPARAAELLRDGERGVEEAVVGLNPASVAALSRDGDDPGVADSHGFPLLGK
jgi:hypothetical protein